MATYSRREVVTRTVEFTVPASPPYGAAWAEVWKAVTAATRELRQTGRVSADQEPSDDAIRILPGHVAEVYGRHVPSDAEPTVCRNCGCLLDDDNRCWHPNAPGRSS
jgi:hypothetical protein